MTRFLDDPELPLDNSKTEREFQLVAKLRLNCLFAGGTEAPIAPLCCSASRPLVDG